MQVKKHEPVTVGVESLLFRQMLSKAYGMSVSPAESVVDSVTNELGVSFRYLDF